MALFQKKPQTSSSAPLYTLGLHQTCLIVGLGNIGREYDQTRHNIGFVCVDTFREALDMSPWVDKKDLKCQLSTGQIANSRVILVKPTTLMNLSGEAVQAVQHFYKVTPANIVVVHDELDIPFGQIRMRVGGGSAGHNGIKSVSQHIGDGYGRIRVGVGAKTMMDAADFVLAKFSEKEIKQLTQLTKETNAILTEYVHGNQLPHDTRTFII